MKKLPSPRNQVQEVLFELIKRINIDRRTMMFSCGILNLTARITDIRQKGIPITTIKIFCFNKFGRTISYAKYSLPNKKKAIEVYLKLVNN